MMAIWFLWLWVFRENDGGTKKYGVHGIHWDCVEFLQNRTLFYPLLRWIAYPGRCYWNECRRKEICPPVGGNLNDVWRRRDILYKSKPLERFNSMPKVFPSLHHAADECHLPHLLGIKQLDEDFSALTFSLSNPYVFTFGRRIRHI